MKNLFFLSGPHGSGKTSLAERLSLDFSEIIVPELSTRIRKFYSGIPEEEIDFFHRQALKSCQRAIENHEYLLIAKENPEKLFLANRCIYDVLVYTKAFKDIGWVSEEERKKIDELGFLYGFLIEPRAIILNPGSEVCKRHLEKRWESGKKKFKEADMKYLDSVCKGFEVYRQNPWVFYIDHEVRLDDPLELKSVYDFMKRENG
jgi:hypothetical protein